jgi:putative ABC transport system permease protein
MTTGPSNPPRRAIARWAWRLSRREWRQQLVLLTLIAVTVATSVVLATLTVDAVNHADGRLGDANALIRVDATDAQAAARGVAAARQRFGDVEVVSHDDVTLPGLSGPLDLRGQDPNGVFGHSTLALRAGRYPTTAGEVALTDRVAALLSAGIGDRVDLGRVTRTVVGLVENPENLADAFALVAPGSDADAPTLTLLVDTGGGSAPIADTPGQARLDIETFSTDRASVTAALLVAITLAMALVGLVAAAGFLVVAERRQRQLGLLAAIGATERHLRLVMLATGAIVGAIAAVVGALVGIAGWILAAPAIGTAAGHRIDRYHLPWELIASCMLMAIVMATAAAWWPARAMARLPVISALSGRPTRPASVHRSTALAGGLLVLGVLGLAFSQPAADHVRPPLLVGGVVAVVLGVVLAAPLAIRALAAPAARLPLAGRLALRDLLRYQARAAAALAAVTLGLGIAVTVVVIAQVNVAGRDQGNLSDRQLVIHVGDGDRGAPVPGLSQAELARLDGQAQRIAATLGHPAVLDLDVAVNPTASDPAVRDPVWVGRPMKDGFRGLGVAYLATPELLGHYGIQVPAGDEQPELLTSISGDVALVDVSAPTERGAAPPTTAVRRVALPAYSSGPRALITQAAMRSHGWVPAPAGWLVETSKPLTVEQIAAARRAAADVGLSVEVRDTQDNLAAVRTIATTAGALLALAIVAMAIGLIRSESASDLRTLTATGASPRTRRALTASTAAALAALGALLGTAGAYLALIAAYRADLGKLADPPMANLLALVVGVPIVAAGAGWLLAGREPRRFDRQALD